MLNVALWFLLHGSISFSENPERIDARGKPEVTIWVKFEGIRF